MKPNSNEVVNEIVGLYLTKILQKNAWILGKVVLLHIIGIILLLIYCSFIYSIIGLGLYYLLINQLYKYYIKAITKKVEEELNGRK